MSSTTGLGLTTARPSDRRSLARRLSATILILLFVAGSVLLWRRLAGALSQALPAESLATLGLLLAVAAIAARMLWQRAGAGPLDRLARWCPTVALLSIGLAIHLPGASPAGLAAFWLAVGFEESATIAWVVRRRFGDPNRAGEGAAYPLASPSRDHSDPSRDRKGAVVPPPPHPPDVDLPVPLPYGRGSEHVAPAATVTQQFTRSRTTEGDDVFSGWLRVEMPAHGRTAAVHVAFCPPFAKAPAIEVQQMEGPAGRIKSVQTLPYGARLDLKLNQPSEESTTVLLRFLAKLNEER